LSGALHLDRAAALVKSAVIDALSGYFPN